MDQKIDFESFVKWVNESPSRNVRIELSSSNKQIWVFDEDFLAGQFCDYSASEINLREKAEEQERREFLRLKEKFEGKEMVRDAGTA